MTDTHTFETTLAWPADAAQNLPPDPAFSRSSLLAAPGKPVIVASSPAVFGGDAARYNPEEMLMLSLSQCHLLTYLAIAAKKRMSVLKYEDRVTGTLGIGASGKMQMVDVLLRPRVTVAKGTSLANAQALHEKAHANCFIANSVNFTVRNEPSIIEAAAPI
jgi:organic hydroperoxide reductase OsmC/OhrA